MRIICGCRNLYYIYYWSFLTRSAGKRGISRGSSIVAVHLSEISLILCCMREVGTILLVSISEITLVTFLEFIFLFLRDILYRLWLYIGDIMDRDSKNHRNFLKKYFLKAGKAFESLGVFFWEKELEDLEERKVCKYKNAIILN